MQVAGEPVALLGDCQPLVLPLRGDQLGVADQHLLDAPDRDRRGQHAQQEARIVAPAGNHEACEVERGCDDDRARQCPVARQGHGAEHAEVDPGRRTVLPDRDAHHQREGGGPDDREETRDELGVRHAAAQRDPAPGEDRQVDDGEQQGADDADPAGDLVALLPSRVERNQQEQRPDADEEQAETAGALALCAPAVAADLRCVGHAAHGSAAAVRGSAFRPAPCPCSSATRRRRRTGPARRRR